MEGPVWIGDAEARRLLDLNALIDVIETSFINYTSGKVVQPVRSALVTENGVLGLMPSLSNADNILGSKLVTFYPNNKDVPSHHAIITLFDSTNGVPRAILDGEYITAQRTAAASAVATKHLARSDAKILTILGAGVQARSHFKVLSSVRQFQEVRIWTRTFASAKKLANEIGGEAFENAEDAVKDADVIVTVTSSTTPILMKKWVKSGAHINAVGACRPDQQELDPELMRYATVIADSKDGANTESGDVILSKAEVFAELGEIVMGKLEVPKDKTTVFKSLGMGIQDLVGAKLVWDAYIQERKETFS